MRTAKNFLLAFLGDPFLLDAASVGAPTHRLRRYWTNILENNQLQQLVPFNYRVPNLNTFLEPDHTTSPVLHSDRPPMRVLNVPGLPRRVLPTLVSFPRSHAFIERASGQPGPGQLYNHLTEVWEEPSVLERERLLGMRPDDTAAGPHVTPLDRQRLLGQAMDHHVMGWFGGIMGDISFP